MEKQETKTDIETHLFKFTAEEERRMKRACLATIEFMVKYGKGRKPTPYYHALADPTRPLY